MGVLAEASRGLRRGKQRSHEHANECIMSVPRREARLVHVVSDLVCALVADDC